MPNPNLKAVLPDPETTTDTDSGGGSDWEGQIEMRLRNLERQMAIVSTRLEYLPTREDLEGVKAQVEGVKTLIAERESRFLKWLIGAVIAVVGTMITAFGAIILVLIRLA